MRQYLQFKFILQGVQYPDTKVRQGHYKKMKLYATISDRHRSRNPQQKTTKLDSTAHEKNHTP